MNINLDKGRYEGWSWVAQLPDIVQKGSMSIDFIEPVSEEYIGCSCYIRMGEFNSDIDAGEHNQIVAIDGSRVWFRYPIARSYDASNNIYYMDTTAEDTQIYPARFRISLASGNARINTAANDLITIGNQLYQLVSHREHPLVVRNINGYEGDIPAGTPVSKSCGLFITPDAYGIVIEGGEYNTIDVSRTQRTRIRGVSIKNYGDRPPIECDGGRDIVFEDCIFSHYGDKTTGHPVSRTAGNVKFLNCQFYNVNVGAGEGSFGYTLQDCKLVANLPSRHNVLINHGWTVDDFYSANNNIDTQMSVYGEVDIVTIRTREWPHKVTII